MAVAVTVTPERPATVPVPVAVKLPLALTVPVTVTQGAAPVIVTVVPLVAHVMSFTDVKFANGSCPWGSDVTVSVTP